MIQMLIEPLFGWMPGVVKVVALGVSGLFFFSMVCNIISGLFSLLPWK